jgi:hypothetical protein
MTFILRFIIVLAVAAAIGVGLFYVVNALPNNFRNFAPEGERFNPQGNPGQSAPPQRFRPEGRERGGEGGFSLFGFVQVFSRFILFAVITFVAVIIKNLFRRKPTNKSGITG